MSIEKDTNERQEGVRVYELGFHFVPTLSEDEVAVPFSHLKSLIEKKGGTFIAEGTPEMTNLAYEISKTVKAQKKRYTEAYFGWVKFELNAEEIPAFEKEVKAFEPILRYLLIATVRENTLVGAKEVSSKKGTKEATEAGTEPTEAPEEVQVD
ncbi:MAG: 30S ribosomal protein S6 [Candidatus Taylorbacteria bacterium]|nr:30S ribosomal protein S6 [Candidatus Taylorbacteria bacterium]